MRKKQRVRKRNLIIFLMSCILFGVTVFGAFFRQNVKLHEEFDRMICDNLYAYTRGQQKRAMGMIDEAQHTLNAVAAIMEVTEFSAEDRWLSVFLETINKRNDKYRVDYISADELERGINGADTDERDRAALEELMKGRNIVSEIRFSGRMGNQYYFAVARPVMKDGFVRGVLRTRMEAGVLTQGVQQSSIYQRSSSVIMKGDGYIVYADTRYPESGTDKNLFSSMVSSGIGADEVNRIKAEYVQNGEMTCCFKGKQKEYYISIIPLDCNDWYLVKFVRSPDVMLRTSAIMKNVAVTGLVMILLTAAFCIAVALLLLKKKQKLNRELERYAILEQFSDTLLFEYYIASDELEFTANAQKQLYLEKLNLQDVSQRLQHMELVHPMDRDRVQKIIDCQAVEGNFYHMEIRLMDKEKRYQWYDCCYKLIRMDNGRPERVIGKLTDITRQRGREDKLREQAQKDMLTNTYNKAGEQIIRERIADKRSGIFLMMDLDNFKEINDTYGHAAGDALLEKVGGILHSVFRTEDVIVRIGGDEFVIFISGSSGSRLAEKKAGQIIEGLKAIRLDKIQGVEVSASIGAALCPKHGTDFEDLYRAADEAMYQVKQDGKGGMTLYREEEDPAGEA